MRIALIEHKRRATQREDARVLAQESIRAGEQSPDVILLPAVLPMEAEEAHEEYANLVEGQPGVRLLPRVSGGCNSQAFPASDEIPVLGERLGVTALLHGDACINPTVLGTLQRSHPAVLVLTPMSESELQAEAMLELAIALSESVAPLVMVVESVGAEASEPGHGGSAIVLLGKVLAESLGSDGELLVAEVPEPLPVLESPEPVPEIPTILAQRLANHMGLHLDMGYPADLSDGNGPR